MGQNAFYSPTVFNYYSPDYIIPGTALNGPEFGIMTTGTSILRANVGNTFAFSRINSSADAPNGTSIDLSEMTQLAQNDPTGNQLDGCFKCEIDARHNDNADEEYYFDGSNGSCGNFTANSRSTGNLFGCDFVAISSAEVKNMNQSRREFIKKSSCALGMAALATQVEHFGLMSALAQKVDDKQIGYKS